ncbi:MAG: GNAT family N-acetyltransferase [Thiohalomonadales bacterium]
MLKLETNRLTLRNFLKEDLQSYLKLRNDKKFKRFYNENDVTKNKSKSLLEMFITESQEQPRTKYQLAITTKDGKLIGSCGIRIEGKTNASVGCELGRQYQASGYAYEASKKIINYAFSELNVHRIYAETISENKAAIKLCEKLGMQIESELTNNKFFQGRWWSTLVLVMVKGNVNNQT